MRYAIAFLALAGCSMSAPMWNREGGAEKDFYMETGQCEAQAIAAGAAGYQMSYYDVTKIFHACMRGKGWYLSDVDWTGKGARDFSRDDDDCSKGYHRGPHWKDCMKALGWTQK